LGRHAFRNSSAGGANASDGYRVPASFGIAKFLAGLFLVLFLVFFILGLTAAKKIID
jgi:hypothetical protein